MTDAERRLAEAGARLGWTTVYMIGPSPDVLPQMQSSKVTWGEHSKQVLIKYANGGTREVTDWHIGVNRAMPDLEVGRELINLEMREVDLDRDRDAPPFVDMWYVNWGQTLGTFVPVTVTNGRRHDARDWAMNAMRELPGLIISLTYINLEVHEIDLAGR